MNWNQIEYFDEAWKERSFVAAARNVPMSPQGFVKSIRSLESELGVELFITDKNGVQTPTDAGLAFRAFADDCLASKARLDERIARMAQSGTTLKIAVAIGALNLLGMGLISEFEQRNPGVHIAVDDLPDLRVERSLREKTNALGITVLPTPSEFETIEITRCDRYAWIPASDPLSERSSIKTADLAGRAVANVTPQFKGCGLLNERIAEAGVELAEQLSSSEMMWLHHFAKSGQGVSITAESVLDLYEEDPSVAAVRIEDMPYIVGVSWLKDRELAPYERAFVEDCRRLAGK